MSDADSWLRSPFKLPASSSPIICLFYSWLVSNSLGRESMLWAAASAKHSGADQHQGQHPPLHSHLWCVERSILDRYSLDNLTSAFNSVCPYLCFVSWLLIKWTPQDLTCRGRTQWRLGLQTQALVSLAIDPLSPHLSLPVISVSPPVMVLLSISNKKPLCLEVGHGIGTASWNSPVKMAVKDNGMVLSIRI